MGFVVPIPTFPLLSIRIRSVVPPVLNNKALFVASPTIAEYTVPRGDENAT